MKKDTFFFFNAGKSIQAKIFIAFMLVTCSAIIIVVYSWYMYNLSNVRDITTNNVTDLIVQANNNFEAILKDVEKSNNIISMNEINVLSVITASFEPPSYDWFMGFNRITGLLSSLLDYLSSRVSGIAVLDLFGKYYTAGNVYIENDILKEAWIQRIKDAEGKPLIMKRSPVRIYNINGDSLDLRITLGRAIMKDGKCIGFILTDIKKDVMQNTFDMKSLPDSTMLVVDAEGYIIYHSHAGSLTGRIVDTEYGDLYKKLDFSKANMNYKFNKEDCLIIPYHSDYTGWTTLAVIPQNSLLKDEMVIRNQTATILILTVLFVFIASMLISKQITRNLKILNKNIKMVSEGNLCPIDHIHSKDEVGQLSAGFEKMVYKINDMLHDIKIREKQKRVLEIKVLQAQISPHFLYNTLNTINYLALLQNADNIKEITSSLIDLLRIAVWNDDIYITFQEELEHVKSYLNIQKYKYYHKFTVEYYVDNSILQCKTIKMILQPIIENSLIHGIEPIQGKGHILIRIEKKDGAVMLRVTDNGVGMTEKQIHEIFNMQNNQNKLRFSGIGVSNVNERIKLKFGEDYGLKIYSQPGIYTTVEIRLPILAERGDEIIAECADRR